MSKWRIVQVKPEGLDKAFIIEEFVVIPAHQVLNPKYRYNQSYWEGTFKLNAGGRPKDWFVTMPESKDWRHNSDWYTFSTLLEAKKEIVQLQLISSLLDELKTFKKKVIQEYD